jgi:hypothetical protein
MLNLRNKLSTLGKSLGQAARYSSGVNVEKLSADPANTGYNFGRTLRNPSKARFFLNLNTFPFTKN